VQTGYGRTTLDFLVCIRGRFWAIETKAPGKKPTPRQNAVMRAIEEAGGTTIWLDDFETIRKCLGR